MVSLHCNKYRNACTTSPFPFKSAARASSLVTSNSCVTNSTSSAEILTFGSVLGAQDHCSRHGETEWQRAELSAKKGNVQCRESVTSMLNEVYHNNSGISKLLVQWKTWGWGTGRLPLLLTGLTHGRLNRQTAHAMSAQLSERKTPLHTIVVPWRHAVRRAGCST